MTEVTDGFGKPIKQVKCILILDEYKQLKSDLASNQAKIDELKNSSENTWEQAKADVNEAYRKTEKSLEKGWENLKEGVENAASDVKESVEDATKK